MTLNNTSLRLVLVMMQSATQALALGGLRSERKPR